jgi:hypothetical protein
MPQRKKEPLSMQKSALTGRGAIVAILLLQFIPLLMFPAASFSPQTQEWWLPLLLTIMVFVADFQLIVRRSSASWPWHLIGFAQGCNIISRLMMLWAHAASQVGRVWTPNWAYIILTLTSMALSLFVLWYTELPEVRNGLLR